MALLLVSPSTILKLKAPDRGYNVPTSPTLILLLLFAKILDSSFQTQTLKLADRFSGSAPIELGTRFSVLCPHVGCSPGTHGSVWCSAHTVASLGAQTMHYWYWYYYTNNNWCYLYLLCLVLSGTQEMFDKCVQSKLRKWVKGAI